MPPTAEQRLPQLHEGRSPGRSTTGCPACGAPEFDRADIGGLAARVEPVKEPYRSGSSESESFVMAWVELEAGRVVAVREQWVP